MVISKFITESGLEFVHSVDEKPRERSFYLHMHDNYELFCFVSGRAGYLVEGSIYDLRPGTVLVMRSSEMHKLIINGGERYERFTINFKPELLKAKGLPFELLTPFKDRPLGEKNVYYPDDISHFSIMEAMFKAEDEAGCLEPDTAIYLNLTCMLSAIALAFARYPEGKRAVSGRNMDREMMNYINDNLTKALSVDDIAAYVHLSPSQLSRRFKELTGTTVYQYITSKRLILAQRKLAKGQSAVKTAAECGFGDYSCFYRLYKKKFGVPPKSGMNMGE